MKCRIQPLVYDTEAMRKELNLKEDELEKAIQQLQEAGLISYERIDPNHIKLSINPV